MQPKLHIRLVARQPSSELQRKADKARRRNIWTQEDVDLTVRYADEMLPLWSTIFGNDHSASQQETA
jgi:hypothetical protein